MIPAPKKSKPVSMNKLRFSSTFRFSSVCLQSLLLRWLGVDAGTDTWSLNFLSQKQESVRVTSIGTFSRSTGSPQSCALSSLLFILPTHDYAARHMTVVGLFNDNSLSTGWTWSNCLVPQPLPKCWPNQGVGDWLQRGQQELL